MATYIRRKLAKLMVKDDTPPSLTISRPEGAVVFTKKEQQRYTWLLQMLDSDSDEQLGGAEGAMFLRRSQLTTDQLREVWRLASGGTSKARLTKEDWLIACKLVAAVQHKGLEPSMAAITGVDPLPIADFHYDNDPDVEADGATAAAIPDGAIRVRLLNPTAYGTGLSKHVRYNVVTSTTLGHFPRREMSVWRRYSDFEWLHSRLTLTFPAAMIPLFPEKRVVGNTDESFVAERAAGLEAYLQRVAAHPVLSTSADMLVFLDGSDGGLEAARSYIEAIAREEADSLLAKAGDLVSSMTSRGDEAKLSLKTDEAYVAGVAAHSATLARLSHAVKAGAALDAASRHAANDTASLGRALLSLADHERRHASAGASAAAAVAAAAAASRRAQDALFSGSAVTGVGGAAAASALGAGPAVSSGGGDAAALAAFASHTSAASADKATSISAMFDAADFSDPYSSLHAAAPGTSAVFGKAPVAAGAAGAPGAGGPTAESLPDLLAAAGTTLAAAAGRATDAAAALESVWQQRVAGDRDAESELAAAIKRREAAVDRVQEANVQLQRRKRALASLKPGAPDHAAKAAEATAGVERADRDLAAAREALDRMSDVLKGEMARADRVRRAGMAAHLAEYARLQAAQARAEEAMWNALLPQLTADPASLEASRENVAAVARRAEAKARAITASKGAAAEKAAALAGAYGGAGAAAGGAGAGDAAAAAAAAASAAGETPAFAAEDAPMPASADEL